MDGIIRISGVAIVAALLAGLLKNRGGMGGIAVAVTAVIVIIVACMPSIQELVGGFRQLASTAGISSDLLLPVLKAVGVCLCAKITAEICRDAGERALGTTVEIAGAAAGIICALPLLNQVLRLVGTL